MASFFGLRGPRHPQQPAFLQLAQRDPGTGKRRTSVRRKPIQSLTDHPRQSAPGLSGVLFEYFIEVRNQFHAEVFRQTVTGLFISGSLSEIVAKV